MKMTIRHLLSILLLPFMAAVVVPFWLESAFGGGLNLGDGSPAVWLARSAGALLIAGGLVLFAWCVSLFAKVGQGTLAPWDPTRSLVAAGPYRFVRNPMISGVAMILVGQALFWSSWAIFIWSCVFIVINHVYFVFSEEPGLEKRFGQNYRSYKENVPRWLPRFRPWSGRQNGS
jgi:protein-S-isoprenylcysteine O-methyltransferase Ste14